MVRDKKQSIQIGCVTSVSGSKVFGILQYSDFSISNEDMKFAAQIGTMVKMRTPRSVAFGLISSLTMREYHETDRQIVEIDLLGESLDYNDAGNFTFQRGMSTYPVLEEPILTTTTNDLSQIYARPKISNVRIGTIRQDSSLPLYVGTDELIGKHFAIIGTTGTGKSCAVAIILRAILNAYPKGHIVVLDPHDEYTRCFKNFAVVITPDTLQLPYWLLNFEEIIELLCSPDSPSRQIEASILKDAIINAKHGFHLNKNYEKNITVDTPIPYQLTKVIQLIKASAGLLNRPDEAQYYLRIISRIESLQRDNRFAFMFSGLMLRDTMADLLSSFHPETIIY